MQTFSAKVLCNMTDRKHDAPALAASALKALGHPPRLRLYWALVNDGPATATMLAKSTGESTGDTSYHLRALAKHHLLEDAPDLGTGRERWWRANPEGFSVNRSLHSDDPEAAAAVALLLNRTARERVVHLTDWASALDRESRAWVDASITTSESLNLSARSLTDMVCEIRDVIARYQASPPQPDAETRHVSVYFDALPALHSAN